jgi:hypothetical protein
MFVCISIIDFVQIDSRAQSTASTPFEEAALRVVVDEARQRQDGFLRLSAQFPASERGAAPSAQESISLEPGKPVERELSGGQSHSYKITMISG